jgi:Rieske Fe-S protein
VQCRCHGSQFRLSDGKVTIGPATSSVPQFEARVREGRIEIRRGPMNGVVYTHAHTDHNRHLPVMSH